MANFTPGLLGIDKAMETLVKRLEKLSLVTQNALVLAGIEVRNRAAQDTPVVTGNLRASAFVTYGGDSRIPFDGPEAADREQEYRITLAWANNQVKRSKNPMVIIGFTASYALKVHENPRAGKLTTAFGRVNPSKGAMRYSEVGKWKFLEDVVKNQQKEIITSVARKVKKGMKI